jgi:hypothetical protein
VARQNIFPNFPAKITKFFAKLTNGYYTFPKGEFRNEIRHAPDIFFDQIHVSSRWVTRAFIYSVAHPRKVTSQKRTSNTTMASFAKPRTFLRSLLAQCSVIQ